jgi:hypothetical protein
MTDRCPDCERLALRNHTLEIEHAKDQETIQHQATRITQLQKQLKGK